MAVYFVEYDLRRTKNYPAIIGAIEELGGIRHLNSSWSIKSESMSAEQLANYLLTFMDIDDGIVVSEVLTWAQYGLEATPHDPTT
nr:hypothetical protein [Delftia acidovorans]